MSRIDTSTSKVFKDEFIENGYSFGFCKKKPTFAIRNKPIRCKLKARFECEKCSSEWTSMKCWVHVWVNTSHTLFYAMEFGQQCKKCRSGGFTSPSHYDSEIERSARWVIKVISTPKGERKDRENGKKGNMKEPHQKSLCEACKLGVCDRD